MEPTQKNSPSTAIGKFSLKLEKQLIEKDPNQNIFFSPLSISSALSMVEMGTGGNTATQISEALCYTEEKPPMEPDQEQKQEQEKEQEQEQEQEQEPQQEQTRDPKGLRPRCANWSQMQMRRQMREQTPISSRLPRYLLKVLNPEDDQDDNGDGGDVHAKIGKLLEILNTPNDKNQLVIANRIFPEKTFELREDYIKDIKTSHKTVLVPMDFKGNPEEERVLINKWVEETLNGKIKDLLPEGSVNSLSKLVLVSAIYFKGNWESKFKESDTSEEEFNISKNEKKPIKMMRQKSKFMYKDIPEDKIKILEMPYQGRDLSMFILLPHEIEDDTTGLEKLEQELTYDKLKDWIETMGEMEVEVKLPRFKLEETYDLKEPLKSLGMVDVFDVEKSDFSGMSSANNLAITTIVHKAFVDVNEEGTEAAAATGVVVGLRSVQLSEKFHANHPFIFFIRHKQTKTILFFGRVCSP